MTDIFFSYSSKDRDRVRPIRDALVAQGFDVFWDQSVPTGTDWDTWIRQHLGKAKCAVVIWSHNSTASDNVRHEATVAKQQGKLVPVLLDDLGADEFPMGLFAIQAANLGAWTGDTLHDEWQKCQNQIETKLAPPWVKRMTDRLDAELISERARREAAERRDRTLQDQIAKEARTQHEFKRERDQVVDDLGALKLKLEETEKARADLSVRVAELSEQLEASEAERERLAEQREQDQLRIISPERLHSQREAERQHLPEEVAFLVSRQATPAHAGAPPTRDQAGGQKSPRPKPAPFQRELTAVDRLKLTAAEKPAFLLIAVIVGILAVAVILALLYGRI